MSVYEYLCEDCEKECGLLVGMSVGRRPVGPVCGSVELRKKIFMGAAGKKECASCGAPSCAGCSGCGEHAPHMNL